jgi:hypothetical protein
MKVLLPPKDLPNGTKNGYNALRMEYQHGKDHKQV